MTAMRHSIIVLLSITLKKWHLSFTHQLWDRRVKSLPRGIVVQEECILLKKTGDTWQQWSTIGHRRYVLNGCWLTLVDHLKDIYSDMRLCGCCKWVKDVHVIVVTDGSRILGLGDLGSNGMGIPIGKLSLYCAAGGIAPHRVLPVVLDVGTDNKELRNDKFYLGVPKPRLTGSAYFHLVDEFMEAVRFRWPNVLVQFEDFNSGVAQKLLDKYRESHLCFNDDIQGTGATALAGLLSAIRAKGDDVSALGDQRIVIVGAGSAGMGIAQVLRQAMMEQGRTEKEATSAFFIVDQQG